MVRYTVVIVLESGDVRNSVVLAHDTCDAIEKALWLLNDLEREIASITVVYT
jgi:hypothetical protein